MKKFLRLCHFSATAAALLLFCEHLPAQADPFKNGKSPATESKNTLPSNIEIRLEVFSLPAEEVHGMFLAKSSDAERYDVLSKLMREDKAKLERLIVSHTLSGRKSLTRSAVQFPCISEYGITVVDSQTAKSGGGTAEKNQNGRMRTQEQYSTQSSPLPFPAKFEMQNLGECLEYEPVLGVDGSTVELNLSADFQRFLGLEKVEEASQPLFQIQKTTTSFSLSKDVPVFLGTLNPPIETGVKGGDAKERIWLAFVTMNW